jgi:para-nitrobenzyl esterase
LRAKTATELIGVFEQEDPTDLIQLPTVFEDGTVIPGEAEDLFEQGLYASKVPIVIGTTKEEIKVFLILVPGATADDEVYQAAASIGSDLFKAQTDGIARRLRAHDDQPDVFVYHFHWGAFQEDGSSPIPAPWDLLIGAGHSIDIAFFLGNESWFLPQIFTQQNRPGRLALTDGIMEYMARFARTNGPNGGGLPLWEPWSNVVGGPKSLILDADESQAHISMANEEFEACAVLASWQARLTPGVYEAALELLSDFGRFVGEGCPE